MIQRICFTKWDMRHILCLDLKTFQGHSFIDIFSKSKLWYKVVILTKISPNLADILEILKLYTHLSTNFSNCSYCVKFINHEQKIKHFAIIWKPVKSEFVLNPIFLQKVWNYLVLCIIVSKCWNKSKDHKKYFVTCLVMSYTGGRRKHGRKSCWVRT